MLKRFAHLSRSDVQFSVCLGAAQGALWWLLSKHITDSGTVYIWRTALLTLVALLPLSCLALRNSSPTQIVLRFLLAQAVLLAAMAAYGAYAQPFEAQSYSFPAHLVCVFLAWGFSLLFMEARLRHATQGGALYACLHEGAYSLTYRFVMASFTQGIFWLLLFLWAALFKVLGIHLFHDLFSKNWFSYPAGGAVFALALAALFGRNAATGAVMNRLASPCLWLLPLACLIALMFLAALPFTGVKPLWDTGYATSLMLALQLAIMAFATGAYEDGTEPFRLPQALKRFITAGLAALPAYALLCVWALALRVVQHGWSADRVWAALIVAWVAAGGAGYAWAALKKSGPWLQALGPINTAMAAAVLGVAIAAGTPLLDPLRIAANSQVGRLLSGRSDVEAFDFTYLRFGLGRYGTEALQELSALSNHPQATLIQERAKDALARTERYSPALIKSTDKLFAAVDILPRGESLDKGLAQYLLDHLEGSELRYSCLRTEDKPCTLLKVDLNDDGDPEYALLDYRPLVFTRRGGVWASAGTLQGLDPVPAVKAAQTGDYRPAVSPWRVLVIGGKRLTLKEDDEQRENHDH